MTAHAWLLLVLFFASPETWGALYVLLFAGVLVWRIRRGRPIAARLHRLLALFFFGGFAVPSMAVALLPLWLLASSFLLADAFARGEDGRWPPYRRPPEDPPPRTA